MLFAADENDILPIMRLTRGIKTAGIILAKSNKKGEMSAYWDNSSNIDFFSPTRADNPKLFRDFSKLKRRLDILSREEEENGENAAYDKGTWIVAIWFHDECDFEPLTKYVGVKNRFPGSPTQ